ncbi:MAG: glycosyltransferase family 39 protein [Planctomycetota bacterium]|nr:glycosyltransferase family 39 protein [Planctomycetota bacterium]
MLFGSWKPVPRAAWVLLAGITLLAAALRFYGLDRDSLWYDEFLTYAISGPKDLNAAWTNIRDDVHPPGHPLLMWAVINAFGGSEFVLRFPSALFGTLSIPLLFLVGWRLYSHREGLAAALFMAVLWCPVAYSQEARNYAMLVMLVLGSVLCWLPMMDALRREGRLAPAWTAGFALCCAGMCYTHYFGLMLTVLMAAFGGIALIRRPKALGLLALANVAVLLLYAPWLPSFYEQLTRQRGAMPFFMKPRVIEMFFAFRFFFNRTKLLVWPVLALYLWMFVQAVRDHRKQPEAEAAQSTPAARASGLLAFFDHPGTLVALWLVAPIMAIWLKSQVSQPFFVNRYLQICMPAAYLLAARGCMRLPAAGWKLAVAPAALGIFFGWHLFFKMEYFSSPQKQQVRQGVEYLARHRAGEPESPVMGSYAGSARAFFDYYFERLGSPARVAIAAHGDQDLPAVEAFLKERKPRRLWVIFSYPEPPGARLMKHLHTTMRAAEHTRLDAADFATEIWLFEARAEPADGGGSGKGAPPTP